MALRESVSIRLDDELGDRLDAISDRTGLRPSDLIRRALVEFIDRADTAGKLEFSLALKEQGPPYWVSKKQTKTNASR